MPPDNKLNRVEDHETMIVRLGSEGKKELSNYLASPVRYMRHRQLLSTFSVV
jgi:hypothetical protein